MKIINIISVILLVSIIMFIINMIFMRFCKKSSSPGKLHIIEFPYLSRLLFFFIMVIPTFVIIVVLHTKCLIVVFIFAIIIALIGIYIFADSFRTDDITYMHKLIHIDKFLSLGLFILTAILAAIILTMK